MSRATLPEITNETQVEGFQYSYEIDEPAKAGEGKVKEKALDRKEGLYSWRHWLQQLTTDYFLLLFCILIAIFNLFHVLFRLDVPTLRKALCQPFLPESLIWSKVCNMVPH